MKIQRQRETFAYRIEAADRSQTINPVPRTKVRPDLYWERTKPQQDTLPLDVPDTIDVKSRTRKEKDNSVPLDRKPQVLWRGVNLDLGHPGAQRIMRTLLGETHNEDTSGYIPGMPSDDDIVETWDNHDYTNQNLGEMILDHAATAYPGQGLGRHWTPLVNEAKGWANDVNFLEGEPLPVLFKSEWMGQGEDTNRNYTMGDWPDELEVTQRPGAPHRITQVYIQHPQTGKWHPVLREPQDRTASRIAMPVPTAVPTTRNQWIKEHQRLEKKRNKAGLPVELVPNFDDDFDNQAYDMQWDTEGLRAGRGSWYARPIEYEGKGKPGIAYRRKVLNEGSERAIPIDYLIHHDDDGKITGILSHFPEGTPFEKPGSITVAVHPRHRGLGIGGKLTQEAESRFGVKLDEQQFTPLGYEMYRRLKHERGEDVPNIFNEKVAASVADHTINRLEKEFNEWWAGTGRTEDDIFYERDLEKARTGPIANWPTIEEFLAEKYPAAAREDLSMGREHASPLLERSLDPTREVGGLAYWDWEKVTTSDPYETGADAVAKHGYDPAEVIAGMLYLHNESHPYRQDVLSSDRQRILDVVKARRKMQKAYDAQQKAASAEERWYSDYLRKLGTTKVAAITAEDYAEAKRLSAAGIDLPGLKDHHARWVLNERPINPATGLPHTPASARGHFGSGIFPYLEAFYPDATQQRMFVDVPAHQRTREEVIHDLIMDDGNMDRMTAGMTALHAEENGQPLLANMIIRHHKSLEFQREKLPPDLQKVMDSARALREDIQKNGPEAKERMKENGMWVGYAPDPATGMPVKPAPTIQPQPNPMMQPPPNPMTQPRNPLAQPSATTPQPAPMPQRNPMPQQAPPMSESDRIRLELQQARAASKLRYAMAWWEMETKNKGYVKGRYYYEHNRSRDNLVKKLYGPGHTYRRTPHQWEEGYDGRYVGEIVGPDGEVVDQITYHGPVF